MYTFDWTQVLATVREYLEGLGFRYREEIPPELVESRNQELFLVEGSVQERDGKVKWDSATGRVWVEDGEVIAILINEVQVKGRQDYMATLLHELCHWQLVDKGLGLQEEEEICEGAELLAGQV